MRREELEDLVAALATDREQAARALAGVLRPKIVKVAHARASSAADAIEIACDALATAINSLPDLKDLRALDSWLWTITCHAVSDFYDRARRQLPPNAELVGDMSTLTALSSAPGPAASAVLSESRGRIVEALALLTAEQRTVVIRRLLRGETAAEVAERVNKEPNAVKQLLFRAIRRLRDSVGRDPYWSGLFGEESA